MTRARSQVVVDSQAAASRLVERRREQPLEAAEVQVVVVAQAPAGAAQLEQVGGALPLRLGVRFDEAPRTLRGVGARRGLPGGSAGAAATASTSSRAGPCAASRRHHWRYHWRYHWRHHWRHLPRPRHRCAGRRRSRPTEAGGVAELGKVLVEDALGGPLVPVTQALGQPLQRGVAAQAEHGRGGEQVDELVGVLGAQHVVVGAAEQADAVGEGDEIGDVHVDAAVVRGLALLQGRAQAGVVQALERRGRQAIGRGRKRRDVLVLDAPPQALQAVEAAASGSGRPARPSPASPASVVIGRDCSA